MAVETPDSGHGWLLYTHPLTTLGQIDPFVGNDADVYGSLAAIARLCRSHTETPYRVWAIEVAGLLWRASVAFEES